MFFLPVLVKSSQALLNLWWSWSRRNINMQICCLPPCFSSPWGVLAHLSVHRGNPSVPLAMPSLPNIFTCTGFSTGNRNESEVFQRWLRLEKTSIKPYNWNHQLNCRKKKKCLFIHIQFYLQSVKLSNKKETEPFLRDIWDPKTMLNNDTLSSNYVPHRESTIS